MEEFNGQYIDIDPDEVVEYIFEELVFMGLVTNREYIHIVLDLLIDYFVEMGLIDDEE